jgi:nucleoside permease NupC
MYSTLCCIKHQTIFSILKQQVAANHLLVASIMSAPAALAIAKLMYPETKQTHAGSNAIKNFPKRFEPSLFRP